MKKILSAAAILLAALCVIGCEKSNTESENNDKVTTGTVPDPEGTVMVNIAAGNDIEICTTGYIKYTTDENLLAFSSTYYGQEMTYVGKGNGLGNLKTTIIPSNGWSSKCAAIEGGLYMSRSKNSDLKTYNQYVGIYVVAHNFGSMVTIKFCPFDPETGAWQ